MMSPNTIFACGALALLLLSAAASTAEAGLSWDERELEVTADALEAEVGAEFVFVNEGDRPVTIERVATSCGCTTTDLAGTEYAPGERGTLEATIDFGSGSGSKSSTIRVITDDPDGPESRLQLRAHIPVGLEIEPRFVYWRPGDPAKAKTIEITAPGDDPLAVEGVEVEGDAFAADFETLEQGRRYRVTVKPTGQVGHGMADGHKTAQLTLQTDSARRFTAYARVVSGRPGRAEPVKLSLLPEGELFTLPIAPMTDRAAR